MLMLKSCKEDVLLECQLDAEPGLLCAICVCCPKVAQTLHPCGTLHYRRDGGLNPEMDSSSYSVLIQLHCPRHMRFIVATLLNQ